MNLVEQAKQIEMHRRRKSISRDHIDLAIAWARGEITLTQANKVMYPERAKGSNAMYAFFAIALGKAVKSGILNQSSEGGKRRKSSDNA